MKYFIISLHILSCIVMIFDIINNYRDLYKITALIWCISSLTWVIRFFNEYDQ